jgi:hypothetical protein
VECRHAREVLCLTLRRSGSLFYLRFVALVSFIWRSL